MLSGDPAGAYQAPGLASAAPAKSRAQPTLPDTRNREVGRIQRSAKSNAGNENQSFTTQQKRVLALQAKIFRNELMLTTGG